MYIVAVAVQLMLAYFLNVYLVLLTLYFGMLSAKCAKTLALLWLILRVYG